MPVIPFPRGVLRAANWQQAGGRPQVQRSAVTGRSTELADFGPGPRWQAECEVVPMPIGEKRAQFQGFEAACQVPGNTFRLPAVEVGQMGPNLIQNPEITGSGAPWVLESAWSVAPTGAGPDVPAQALFASSGAPSNNALSNGGLPFAFAPGARLFLSSTFFRSVGSTGTLFAFVNFRDAGNALLGTLGVDFIPLGSAGSFQRVAGFVTAPANTATALVYLGDGLTAGFVSVTAVRAALLPERATVNGAANAGRSLALSGLALSQRNLRAGQLITVPLPGGDEQLVRLAADLVADGSGNGTASLATPLRRTPAAGAVVQLDRPWALMRAVSEAGWNVRPGGIYGHRLLAEEAY